MKEVAPCSNSIREVMRWNNQTGFLLHFYLISPAGIFLTTQPTVTLPEVRLHQRLGNYLGNQSTRILHTTTDIFRQVTAARRLPPWIGVWGGTLTFILPDTLFIARNRRALFLKLSVVGGDERLTEVTWAASRHALNSRDPPLFLWRRKRECPSERLRILSPGPG